MAGAAELCGGMVVTPADRPLELLLSVGVVDEGLVLVRRERHIPCRSDGRAVARRDMRRVIPPADALLYPDVLYERAGLGVDVDPIALAVVHIHEAVVSDVDRVDDLQESERGAILGLRDCPLLAPH